MNTFVAYTGVVLKDNGPLLDAIQERLKPLLAAGWVTHNKQGGESREDLPHHFTLTAKALPDNLKHLVGATCAIECTHWGQNDQAAAVKIRCASTYGPIDRLEAGTNHITCAVSPTGKPFNSNQITEWTPLETPISLIGHIEEVRREKR